MRKTVRQRGTTGENCGKDGKTLEKEGRRREKRKLEGVSVLKNKPAIWFYE